MHFNVFPEPIVAVINVIIMCGNGVFGVGAVSRQALPPSPHTPTPYPLVNIDNGAMTIFIALMVAIVVNAERMRDKATPNPDMFSICNRLAGIPVNCVCT